MPVEIKTIAIVSPNAAGTMLGTVANGGQINKLDEWDALIITAGVRGATGGTLDLVLQTTLDGSNRWVDYLRYSQLGAGAAAVQKFQSVSKFVQIAAFPTVGFDASPALAAGSVVGGPFGESIRIVAIAGAGTSAGAPQSITFSCSRSVTFFRNRSF